MSELKAHRRSSLIALAGFCLLFEALAFLLYMAAWPDYFLLYDIQLSGQEILAWVAGMLLLAAGSIAGYERRFNKRVLLRLTVILLGVWVVAFFYVLSAKPLVMVIGNELIRVR